MNNWIDVTRALDEHLTCWPGRRPPEISWDKRIDRGGHCNVSSWRLSAHTGTHVDAPLHFVDGARSIDQVPLDTLVGACEVVDLTARKIPTLEMADAQRLVPVKRLLIATGFARDGQFTHHPALLTLDAAKLLLASGLKLIGTDRLTVDASEGTDFPIHHALLGAGCVIIEGLQLTSIVPGTYDMVALPLPIVGAEASPARVMLRATEEAKRHA
jgi:arylformamidase